MGERILKQSVIVSEPNEGSQAMMSTMLFICLSLFPMDSPFIIKLHNHNLHSYNVCRGGHHFTDFI